MSEKKENKETKEEEIIEDEEDMDFSDGQSWFQENIKIVLSVVIVLAIGLGVYFYSKRSDEGTVTGSEDDESTKEIINEEETTSSENTDLDTVTDKELSEENLDSKEMEQTTEKQLADNNNLEDKEIKKDAVELPKEEEANQKEEPTVAEVEAINKALEEEQKAQAEDNSTKTGFTQKGENYEVTASHGDNLTKLSRFAVKQYLNANGDASLTKEHKIFIEDYLAKKKGYSSVIKVGKVESFSSSDIQEAITKAKNLSPNALNNLKVYSAKVSNL